MRKKFLTAILLLISAASMLAANEEIVKKTSYSEDNQEAAVFEVDKIDPERTVVDIEVVDGMSFKRMFMYFIEENGKETVYEYNEGLTIPLYLYFIENAAEMMDKYEKIEFYLNGRKGEELFQNSTAELTFRDRPFVAESIKATAKRDINGRVEPALFPLEKAAGADFAWTTMEEGEKGKLYVYVTNVNTGKELFIDKQTYSQVDERTMHLRPYIWGKYAEDYTHLGVRIDNPATEDLGPAVGTISLISRSREHQEESKKLADEAAKSSEPGIFMSFIFFIGLVIFIVGGFFFKFVFWR